MLAVLALSACSPPVVTPDGGTPPPRDSGMPPPVDSGVPDAGDATAAIFAPDHLVDVRIELAAADWETMRNQTRNLFTLLTGDCTSQPFPSPFTTFNAVATVDGKRLEQTTIKKKGFIGSLSTNRPSLKLKFDDFIADQEVSGVDSLTLNNAQQDPSIVRQCLGYALFTKAGIPAPRCNFAHVFVNGVDLGVYAHVEGIDKDLLKRHFEKKGGNLYEGTLSDFNTTYINTFDLKDDKTDRTDLNQVLAAMTVSDAMLVSRLEAVINLDEFIDFWAMETLVRHWDGYAGNTNNFFIYDDPTTNRFFFIPWGADAVFHTGPVTVDQPEGPMLRGELPRRLYAIPEIRARYLARIQTFLTTVFDEAQLNAEITRMQALITPYLHPIQVGQFAQGLTEVRGFVNMRRARLTALLATPPATTPGPRSSPCMKQLGTFSSDFSTTWGTLGAMNPFATGPATFDLQLDGGVPPFFLTGASGGLDTSGNDGAKVGINLVAAHADGGFTAAVIRINPGVYPPPNSNGVPFDLFANVGYVLQFSGGQVVPVALFGTGTLSLTDAGVGDGGVMSGSVRTELVSWPFGGGM
ncbi:MAG: CotH kinase family protein [Archangium sp.]